MVGAIICTYLMLEFSYAQKIVRDHSVQDWNILLELCVAWQNSLKVLWWSECHLLGITLLIASKWLTSQYQAGCDVLFQRSHQNGNGTVAIPNWLLG